MVAFLAGFSRHFTWSKTKALALRAAPVALRALLLTLLLLLMLAAGLVLFLRQAALALAGASNFLLEAIMAQAAILLDNLGERLLRPRNPSTCEAPPSSTD